MQSPRSNWSTEIAQSPTTVSGADPPFALVEQRLVAVLTNGTRPTPSADVVTSMNDGSNSTSSNRSGESLDLAFQFWRQHDLERLSCVTDIADSRRAIGESRTKRNEVDADLNTIAVKQSLASSRRFYLEGYEKTSVADIGLEQVVGFPADTEIRITQNER